MRIPYDPFAQEAPQQPPDVRAQVITNPGGSQAIGSGLQQLGKGIDQVSDEVARAERVSNKIAGLNGLTKLQKAIDVAGEGDLSSSPSGDSSAPAGPNPEVAGDVGSRQAAASAAGMSPVKPQPYTSAAVVPPDDDSPHELPATAHGAVTGALGDTVPQQGFFNTRGMDAAKYAHGTLDAVGKAQADIAASMPNDAARAHFMEHSPQMLEGFRQKVVEHSLKQHDVALEDSANAAKQQSFSSLNHEIERTSDADSAIKAADGVMAPVLANIDGLYEGRPDAAAAVKAGYRQEMANTLAQKFIDAKDPVNAQKVLDARKDDLAWGKNGPEQLRRLQEAVDGMRGAQDADSGALEIVNKAKLGDTGLVDMAPIEKARTDPSIPAEVRKRVDYYAGVVPAQNRAVAANHASTLWSQYDQHQNVADVDPQELQWAKDNDHALYEQFQRQVAEDAKDKARASRPTKGSNPDQDLWFSTWMYDHDKNPDKYKDMTPDQLAHDARAYVTQPQLQKMQDALREQKGQKTTGPDSAPAWQRDRIIQGVDGAFSGKGSPALDPGMRGQVYNQIDDKLRSARQAWRAAGNKGDLPADQVDKLVAGEMQKVKVGGTGFFFNDEVPRAQFEVDPQYRGKSIVGEPAPSSASSAPNSSGASAPAAAVPDDAAKAIRAQVQAKLGRAASDEEVQRIYEVKHPPKAPAAKAAPTPVENLGKSAPPTPQPDAQLIHPANVSVMDQLASFLPTKEQLAAESHQQYLDSLKPKPTLRQVGEHLGLVETEEQKKATADAAAKEAAQRKAEHRHIWE